MPGVCAGHMLVEVLEPHNTLHKHASAANSAPTCGWVSSCFLAAIGLAVECQQQGVGLLRYVCPWRDCSQ